MLGKTLCLPGTGSKSRSPKIQQKEELEEWGAENRPRQMQGAPGVSGHKGIFAFGERYGLEIGVCMWGGGMGGILSGTCLPWKLGIRRT